MKQGQQNIQILKLKHEETAAVQWVVLQLYDLTIQALVTISWAFVQAYTALPSLHLDKPPVWAAHPFCTPASPTTHFVHFLTHP